MQLSSMKMLTNEKEGNLRNHKIRLCLMSEVVTWEAWLGQTKVEKELGGDRWNVFVSKLEMYLFQIKKNLFVSNCEMYLSQIMKCDLDKKRLRRS